MLLSLATFAPSRAASPPCETPGWFPEDFGLKDHTVFQFDGYTYIASIYLPGEKKFAYGRSLDVCTWENLGPILTERTAGDWDETAIWAPYVLEDQGVYYMYYTGVNHHIAQSIMLATSTNPADPTSWQEQGMVFQPSHPDAVWSPTAWADCRDPHVIFANDLYYLYYTGLDTTGGIVGVATAETPSGPWTDLGAVIPPAPGHYFESPSVFFREGTYYLTYHEIIFGNSAGTRTQVNITPDGLYTAPVPLAPGWAHEFWLDAENAWFTSYLTGYNVTISPVHWNPYAQPPRPLLGETIYFNFLPLVNDQE